MSGGDSKHEERELPRYWPGPPFPAQRYVPGQVPHAQKPSQVGARAPWDGNESTLRTAPGFLWGVDLYNHGFYWEAHEEWEELWKQAAARSSARYFLQGLIQCAAASLKGSSEQWTACQTLGEKGLSKLAKVRTAPDAHYQGLDLRKYVDCFRAYCTALSAKHPPPQILLELTTVS